MRKTGPPAFTFSPTDFSLFAGLPVPDPITFVISSAWLDRPNLYPRQATLIKVIFLREDLFTPYDYQVVAEWETSFRQTGSNGITPNILDRMRYLRENGYSYFREVLLVMGRRAGKGYLSALCLSYVLWRFMAKGDPQSFYGVDRDKQLACFVFAAKKDQATVNLWKDIANIVLGAPCFEKYVSRPMGESLSVYAPHDFVRQRKLQGRNISTTMDQATFIIQPKESTLTAGRGPASFAQAYDEMAHLVSATGAARSAEEVFSSATPSLDQFKKDAFIIEPSSPWQMMGQFYQNWQNCLAVENGQPLYPESMMVQLTSWDIYLDWSDAHLLPLFPTSFEGDLGEYGDVAPPRLSPLKLAIQEYDDGMRRLEKANPETFAVERRSEWQAVIDAYLNRQKIAEMFQPWKGRTLEMQTLGRLDLFYKGHADPGLANANFGLALGHGERDDEGFLHCVFDYIHHYAPADYDDHIIDYIGIGDDIWSLIERFKPDEFTYDQWQSAEAIQRINQKLRKIDFPKRVLVYEKTATVAHNWERAECFKIALNQGWIHAPEYALAELELRYLQLKNGKVIKQDTGPVQTKDVADCFDYQTEVLTETGWKLFKDVERGERVATRSPAGILEYQVPTEYIERHHTGVMYEYDTHRINFSVTPKHRILVVGSEGRQRFIHAENLDAKRYFIPKTALVESRTPSTIIFHNEDLSAARKRIKGRGGNRIESGWTAEQDDYLIKHYATTSMVELCAVLGKTRGAIYNRAKPKNLDLTRGQIGDRIGDRPTPLPETKVEDFAAFLGIWLAEGRKMRDKYGYDIKITQTKPQAIEWIDNLCARLPWPVQRSIQGNGETAWIVKSHGLREYLRACQGDGHELFIPDEVFSTWTQREMEALLEGLLVGDGCWSSQADRFTGYYSTSKRLIDDVQRLIMHLGYSSGAAKIIQRQCQYKANHDLWYVGVNTSQTSSLHSEKLRQVDYDGPVYCLTVPNSTLLVRRKGVPLWSGNCLMEVVWTILGEQVRTWTHQALSNFSPSAMAPGGFDPYTKEREVPLLGQELSALGRRNTGRTALVRGGGLNPARNPQIGRGRRR